MLSDFVRIGEESRTNTAVIDPTTGEQTEINERGPKVTPHEVELFVDKLLYLAKGASVCVFAGSLPRDVDTDIYAFLIRELRRLNVTTVIDTDGDPLRRAVRSEPDIISPNVLEAEELVGHEFNDDEDRTYAVREMCELGAREAIMTMTDGVFARMLPSDGRRRAVAVPGARPRRGDRAARHRRLRRRVPGRLRRRPATRADPSRSRSRSAWRAAPSPPSISGPAWSTRNGSNGCSARSRSSGPRRSPQSAVSITTWRWLT